MAWSWRSCVAIDEWDEGFERRQHPERHHDLHFGGQAGQGAEEQFEHEAQRRRHDEEQDGHGDPGREAPVVVQLPVGEGAEHGQRAIGEVEDADCLVGEDDAHGRQPIDAPREHPDDDERPEAAHYEAWTTWPPQNNPVEGDLRTKPDALDRDVDVARIGAPGRWRVAAERPAAGPVDHGVESLDQAGPGRIVATLYEGIDQHLRRLPGQEAEATRLVARLIGGQLLLVELDHGLRLVQWDERERHDQTLGGALPGRGDEGRRVGIEGRRHVGDDVGLLLHGLEQLGVAGHVHGVERPVAAVSAACSRRRIRARPTPATRRSRE